MFYGLTINFIDISALKRKTLPGIVTIINDSRNLFLRCNLNRKFDIVGYGLLDKLYDNRRHTEL